MGASVGRIARGVSVGAVLGTLAFFAVSKDARHRLDAAKRAFGDPALLEGGGAGAAAEPAEPLPAITQVSELKVAGEFAALPDDSEDPDTSVVRTAASGTSALINVDLPIPDCPTSTVCCAASHGSTGAASRLAATSTTG